MLGVQRQADQAGQVPRPPRRVVRDREPGADQGSDAPVPVPAPREGPAEQGPRALQGRAQEQGREPPTSPTSRWRAAHRARSRRTASASPSTTRRKLVKGSSYADDAPRTYTITATNRSATAPTRWSFFTGYIGEYYGLMGTSWRDPPILQHESEKRTIGGREYLLFYNGDRLRMVGWKTDHAVVLDLQHPAPERLREGDAGRRARRSSGRGDHAGAKAAANVHGMPEQAPDRRDRRRVGRSRHRRLLRRAWPPRLVPRHRRAQDRDAARRRGADLRAGPGGPGRAQLRAPALRDSTSAPLLEHARLLFVCVDTPPTYSGDADLSRVEAVIEELPDSAEHAIVMKSTVPVGTGANVRRRLGELGKRQPRLRLEPGVPEGGLGGRRTSCTRTAWSSASDTAVALGGGRGGRAVRAARLPGRAHRRRLGRDDQAGFERVPRDQDLLHQRDRERLRGGRRRRERGRARNGPRPAHRRQLPERGDWLRGELSGRGRDRVGATARAHQAHDTGRPLHRSPKGRAGGCRVEPGCSGSPVLARGFHGTEFLPVDAVTRRPFDGEIVEVRTKMGRRVRTTPDHPFVAAERPGGPARVELASDLTPTDWLPVAQNAARA